MKGFMNQSTVEINVELTYNFVHNDQRMNIVITVCYGGFATFKKSDFQVPSNLFCLDMKFHSTYRNDKSHRSSKTPDERLGDIHPTAEIFKEYMGLDH